MQAIQEAFKRCKAEKRAAFVPYIMAGFPEVKDTPDLLLALERGGADLIELGTPFSDPIGDGPTIQYANTVAIQNGVTIESTLQIIRKARSKGLKTPIVLMGYYNPVRAYGHDRLCKDSLEAGVNGFIIVDIPPIKQTSKVSTDKAEDFIIDEAKKFREECKKTGLSYVPLIAPSTTDSRINLICKLADTFVYIISLMGVTGARGTVDAGLPALIERVKRYSGNKPTAVGFGISNHEQFASVSEIAEGIVVGSRLITILQEADPGDRPGTIERVCLQLNGRDGSLPVTTREVSVVEAIAKARDGANGAAVPTPSATITQEMRDDDEAAAINAGTPGIFGDFGGSYAPESLVTCLDELDCGFEAIKHDESFWDEYRSYYEYMGRPGHFHRAERLTEYAGGADIWLKREDLNHTGSHKINNALGQVLLARRLGKTRIIAETGAGQHGVATATVCAKFGMACTIYMGAEDVRRQALNVFRIKLLGAKVIAVEAGTRTLRDAVNEAMRQWVTELDTTHFTIGSAIGPHPFPTIVRTFQSVIGTETKAQMLKAVGKLPDAVVACVGGGSNSIGMFYPFVKDTDVQLVGVEAGGDGVDTARHSATLTAGSVGVLHGVRTYVLQNRHGQISDTHSISAGLDYPGVGPELAWLKDSGRASFLTATDAEALEGFRRLTECEGIIPALESAHGIFGAIKIARQLGAGKHVVVCLSGRGDKDVQSVADELPKYGPLIGWDLRF